MFYVPGDDRSEGGDLLKTTLNGGLGGRGKGVRGIVNSATNGQVGGSVSGESSIGKKMRKA